MRRRINKRHRVVRGVIIVFSIVSYPQKVPSLGFEQTLSFISDYDQQFGRKEKEMI